MVNGVTQEKTAVQTIVRDLGKRKRKVNDNTEKKARCEARGGTWDEVTQSCILPEKETAKSDVISAPKIDSTINNLNKAITDSRLNERVTSRIDLATGEALPLRPDVQPSTSGAGVFVNSRGIQTGLRLPDGQVFLGLTPEEISRVAQKQGLTELETIGQSERTRQSQRERILDLAKDLGIDPQQIAQANEEQIVQLEQEFEDRKIGTAEKIGAEGRRIESQTLFGRLGQAIQPSLTPQQQAQNDKVRGILTMVGGAGASLIGTIGLGAFGGWAVGGRIVGNPATAVKIGTGIKNALSIKGTLSTLGTFGLLTLAFDKAGDFLSIFNRQLPAKQQALNTLGQETSTIIGDSLSGAGDFRAGLTELERTRRVLLELEREITRAGNQDLTFWVNKDKTDILADIEDQLRTIDEGERDIRSFALQGAIPELTDFELQNLLRELEAEGLVAPVDLTKSRRQTTKIPV